MTIWHMRIACWIPKAINTHSDYVILIAFPLEQWLNQRVPTLRYTYNDRLVIVSQVYENEPINGLHTDICQLTKRQLQNCLEFNTLNAELNPIRHLLALVGARHIVHVSRIRVNSVLKYLTRYIFR